MGKGLETLSNVVQSRLHWKDGESKMFLTIDQVFFDLIPITTIYISMFATMFFVYVYFFEDE